jgi:hypothetical protein
MVYFFVDKDGTEGCASERPYRDREIWTGYEDLYFACVIVPLPKGTIEKVIGRVLTWDDEPFEYYGIEEYDKLNEK